MAAWFPTAERGRASAIFNASQYFSLVHFAPLFGWLTQRHGWQSCFWFMGVSGLCWRLPWWKSVLQCAGHPLISRPEIDCIEQGGGLVQLDCGKIVAAIRSPGRRSSMLLRQRMLVGIYIGPVLHQYADDVLSDVVSVVPGAGAAHEHFAGGLCCGVAGTVRFCGRHPGRRLLGLAAARGYSLTFARKAPIIAGMLLSVTMIACNYTNAQTLVMALMSLAFFGKGFGALGWTVIADTSPKELVGVNGGVFNLFGNPPTITTPTVIGFWCRRPVRSTMR